jgi:hypothetical protein
VDEHTRNHVPKDGPNRKSGQAKDTERASECGVVWGQRRWMKGARGRLAMHSDATAGRPKNVCGPKEDL